MTERPIIDIRDARVQFGGLIAVRDVSFSVSPGEVVGLVGPNGAGKTTLFNAISGLVPLASGEIGYRTGDKEVRLDRKGAWRRAGLGISRTFQDSRLIDGLPVSDQLATGMLGHARGWGALLRLPPFVTSERDTMHRADEIMDWLGLSDSRSTDVEFLSAPARRLVDLGRALMSRPRLLLLDEIGAGMPPADKQRVVDVVTESVARHGTTVVLVEHDMRFVRTLTGRTVVLAEGAIIAEGAPEKVLREPAVLEAYIGRAAAKEML
ncbi:MAG: ABC-type transporter, ATPase and permease component [Subtercola sp.]|jgi:ABC-type branched-subunit amino acid transport system ATPase component|nr:ABC-type transporter, ATPase and permease component [Subtercola sp.]